MTVEAALVIPLLVLVLGACLAGVACLSMQLRCIDAAREAARLAGRGDLSGATAAAGRLAGDASIQIEEGGDVVRVRVVARPLGGVLPGVSIEATATAAMEGAR